MSKRKASDTCMLSPPAPHRNSKAPCFTVSSTWEARAAFLQKTPPPPPPHTPALAPAVRDCAWRSKWSGVVDGWPRLEEENQRVSDAGHRRKDQQPATAALGGDVEMGSPTSNSDTNTHGMRSATLDHQISPPRHDAHNTAWGLPWKAAWPATQQLDPRPTNIQPQPSAAPQSRLAALESENAVLRQTLAALARELADAKGRVAQLEQQQGLAGGGGQAREGGTGSRAMLATGFQQQRQLQLHQPQQLQPSVCFSF